MFNFSDSNGETFTAYKNLVDLVTQARIKDAATANTISDKNGKIIHI